MADPFDITEAEAKAYFTSEQQPASDTNKFEADTRLRGAAILAQDRNPDAYARSNAVARRNDWPTEAVANDSAHFELHDRLNRLSDLHESAPRTAAFLSDTRRMALAKDDVDTLARMERALRPRSTMQATPEPSFLEEVLTQAHGAWVRGKNYVSTFLLDPMLPDTVSDDTAPGLPCATQARTAERPESSA